MKKILLVITLFIGTFVCQEIHAEEVSFTANAPSAVVMGETFRLTYTVNTHNAKGFRVGNITDFDVLMGPTQSSSCHETGAQICFLPHEVANKMPVLLQI